MTRADAAWDRLLLPAALVVNVGPGFCEDLPSCRSILVTTVIATMSRYNDPK